MTRKVNALTMQLTHHLCLFLALALGRFSAADRCPPSENIFPCTCQEFTFGSSAYMKCAGLQNAEQMMQALNGVKGLKLYSLEIESSNLGYVPGYAFKGTSFKDLTFIYTNITSIGDDENPPLTGLENSLQSLSIIKGFHKPLTKPIRLDHLKKLTFLHSLGNVIPKLENEWFGKGPATLEFLAIDESDTEHVGDKAFAHLNSLRNLHFTGNSVTLQRSALPEDPIYLNELGLTNNKIVELPTDMFTNLPALRHLNLNRNEIQTLPENTFRPILKQLQVFLLLSNPLDCGPKMKWIFKDNLQGNIDGTCATPQRLSGRDVRSLTADDISD